MTSMEQYLYVSNVTSLKQNDLIRVILYNYRLSMRFTRGHKDIGWPTPQAEVNQ